MTSLALQKAIGLGNEPPLPIEYDEMKNAATYTFYRPSKKTGISNQDELVEGFRRDLEVALRNVIGKSLKPYEEVLERGKISHICKLGCYACRNSIAQLGRNAFCMDASNQIIFGIRAFTQMEHFTKIKRGVCVITTDPSTKVYDATYGVGRNTIIAIMKQPDSLTENSPFKDHFEFGRVLFTRHMLTMILAVSKDAWTLYNWNGSHSRFSWKKGDTERLARQLYATVLPKVSSPMRPLRLGDLIICETRFDPTDIYHGKLVDQFVVSGNMLHKTELYPKGTSISELTKNANAFHRYCITAILDGRQGYSFGFLAVQMPLKELPRLVELLNPDEAKDDSSFSLHGMGEHIVCCVKGRRVAVEIPEVWVLSQRSGADKTNSDPQKDILKLGLKDGQVYLELPCGHKKLPDGFRPSFDTRLMFAHAIGNAIVAALLQHFGPHSPQNSKFVEHLCSNGMAMGHWHGYLNPDFIPEGWHVHGEEDPQVACASLQSAIYAIRGKLDAAIQSIEDGVAYMGDIHVEPSHGTVMSHWSLPELAELLCSDENVAELGEKYMRKVVS